MSFSRSGTMADLNDASTSRSRVPAPTRSYLPLSVSTRSMSRHALASSTSSANLTTPHTSSLANSKLVSSRNLASASSSTRPKLSSSTSTYRMTRAPLRETTLNDATMLRPPLGKRKSDESGGGARKVVRLAVSPPCTPKKATIAEVPPVPTPARHILRFGKLIPVDDDDDEEGGEEALEGIVPRPPTPPRVHDRSSAMAEPPLRPMTPSRPTIPALQVSTTPDATPPAPRPPITPSGRGFAGLSKFTTPQPKPAIAQEKMQAASEVPQVKPTPSRISIPTPQRLGGFGGMSRLGVAPSPASKSFLPSPHRPLPPPPPPLSSTLPPAPLTRSTLPASTSRTMTRSSRIPPASSLTRSSSKISLSRSGSLSNLASVPPPAETELPRVAEDVEMEEELEQPKPKPESKPEAPMPPPSKIPTMRTSRAMQPLPPASSMTRTASSMSLDKPSPPEVGRSAIAKPSLSSLPERRPGSRPVMTPMLPPSLPPSASSSSLRADSGAPTKRKPSYPSLGHGPPRRETPRMVSVPVPSHVIDRTEPVGRMEVDEPFLPLKTNRSVSNPEGRNRLSLSMSSRREGWTQTSNALAGLSDALEKLKVKKELSTSVSRPLTSSTIRHSLSPTALAETPKIVAPSERLSAVHQPRPTSAASNYADMSMENDRSLAALMCSTNGGGCFKGVVAFVDVWTADGTDSGGVFVDMLKGLGARVLGRPTESCTHIIYKSGRPSTLTWYRKQEDPPHIVGISWVTKSKEAGKRLLEESFLVDVAEEDIFQKVGRAPDWLKVATKEYGAKTIEPAIINGIWAASVCASIIEARRKSLVYARKHGCVGAEKSKDRLTIEEGSSGDTRNE